jgi:hypothetical protein
VAAPAIVLAPPVLADPPAPASAAAEPAAPADRPAPEPPAETVRLTFASEPKSASVVVAVGGEEYVLGLAPASLEVPRGAEVKATFSKGYLRWTASATADGDKTVTGRYTSPKAGKAGAKPPKSKGKIGNGTVDPYR